MIILIVKICHKQIKNIVQVYKKLCKYDVFIKIEKNNEYKLKWTKQEINIFLDLFKCELIKNGNDVLIMIMSCHGNKRGILDSKGATLIYFNALMEMQCVDFHETMLPDV